MTSFLRKSLPFLGFAFLGAAGVCAWKMRAPSAPASVQVVEPSKPKSSSRPRSSRPQLAYLNDPGQPWQVRIELLRQALSEECGEPEIRELYHFMAKGAPEGELPEHGYVIANEIMEQLLRHDPNPQRFSSSLLEVLHDSAQPLVVRDYAIQHLVTWLTLHPPKAQKESPDSSHLSSTAPSPEITAHVFQSLVVAATNPELEQTTIPGTTLMMFINLARQPGGVDFSEATETLKPWLSRALEDGSILSTPIRVSAIQAAGILDPEEFRPVIRNIAYAENGQSSLRLSSIAVLGQCGETADLEKLRHIASAHPELSYAAQEAITSLTSRLAQGNSN
ncbi:MAG: hypothetical protein V4727_10805 [Verrucomicrobiota bacterium]